MDKMTALRKWLQREGADAYIQPTADEFQGEYVPPHAKRLEWLTGFSGSAGLVIVLKDKAIFFTDGRYILQAKTQLGGDYIVINISDERPEVWLKRELANDSVLAYDARLFTHNGIEKYREFLNLKSVDNPIDLLWEDRPEAPCEPIKLHEEIYAGEKSESKRRRIAENIAKKGADCALLTAPDSVCWLLNIRGNDVPHTPFVLANVILHKNCYVDLFIDFQEVATDIKCDARIRAEGELESALQGLSDKKVLVDPAITNSWFFDRLDECGAEIIYADDPCQLPKSLKNEAEIKGARNAHIRDGAALVKFLYWLDKSIADGEEITEISAVRKLDNLRAENDLFQDTSFDTISGYAANGAIIHYSVDEKSSATIAPGSLYLVDSGGQYLDGTTDVTRTVAIGELTNEQKHHFTLVLRGHIALAEAVFPKGTTGSALDVLARAALWQEGLDYDHGTGHGVGSYLSVHEGPQRISKVSNNVALQPGMIISNEPGYYKEGAYGIRIESLLVVVESDKKGFYCFETLTKAPIDRRLVDISLLAAKEINWLNDYHNSVRETLEPNLGDEVFIWLKKQTNPL